MAKTFFPGSLTVRATALVLGVAVLLAVVLAMARPETAAAAPSPAVISVKVATNSLIKNFDSNRNGVIEKDAGEYVVGDDSYALVLDRIDTDDNGRVSFGEMKKFVAKFDRNRDKRLSAKEQKRLLAAFSADPKPDSRDRTELLLQP